MRDRGVRAAVESDLPHMLAIYNEVLLNTTAIYSSTPSTLEERAEWWRTRTCAGFPVLVAEQRGHVVGFSSYGEFRRSWDGYVHSVEHSVHVRSDCRGQGIGRQLLEALFPHALAAGKHVMVGAIDASNVASLGLHERLGFSRVAHFKEVGRKFDRWLDLVFVQKFITSTAHQRAAE